MPLTTNEISALLKSRDPGTTYRRIPESFDRAAAFLLDFNFENLFEAAVATELDKMTYRCKGCLQSVKRIDRKQHWLDHKRETEL